MPWSIILLPVYPPMLDGSKTNEKFKQQDKQKTEKGLRAIADGLSASTRADHKSQNSLGR